jgi:hypothetical protein
MPSDMLYWRRSSALTPGRAGTGVTLGTPGTLVAPVVLVAPRAAGAAEPAGATGFGDGGDDAGNGAALAAAPLAGGAGATAGGSAGRSSVSRTMGAGRASGAGNGLAAGVLAATAGAVSRRSLDLMATLIVVAGISSGGTKTLTALSKSAAWINTETVRARSRGRREEGNTTIQDWIGMARGSRRGHAAGAGRRKRPRPAQRAV